MSKFLHIALEGIDGCGKGIQTELLVAHLKRAGHEVVRTKEPTDRSDVGRTIRDELHDRTLVTSDLNVLFAADRIMHKMWMRRTVDGSCMDNPEPQIFVADRSLWSAYAYHGVDNPMHEFLSPESTRPHFTVVLDLDPEIAMERMVSGGRELDRFENLERLKQARDAYVQLAETHRGKIALVKGGGGIYQVAHEVCACVDRYLKKVVYRDPADQSWQR